jgi:hypothetical protein
MMEQLGMNVGGNVVDIKDALTELVTNMETYNTTGTANQGLLQSTLTTLVTAIGNSSLNVKEQTKPINNYRKL